MSSDGNLSKNPFACLFRSVSQVEEVLTSSPKNESEKRLNYLLEKIFLFTLDNGLLN
jgi:hypothetical protein